MPEETEKAERQAKAKYRQNPCDVSADGPSNPPEIRNAISPLNKDTFNANRSGIA